MIKLVTIKSKNTPYQLRIVNKHFHTLLIRNDNWYNPFGEQLGGL